MSETGALSRERIEAACERATRALLAEMNPHGHWTGELSSSALSTATAVTALSITDRATCATEIQSGLRWLVENQNADGGWGDTVLSKSNISTTALCWASFGAAQADNIHSSTVAKAEEWLSIATVARPLTPAALARAIADRYGKDRTFSVPILMMCALSGRLGPDGWKYVMPLPFELAAFPHQLFGALQLPVVSYALPALIAIGQVIHHYRPTRNPLTRVLRSLLKRKTLRVLASIQPSTGGFLEATPLTSFVTMSLSGMGRKDHVVARNGVRFLLDSVRSDGSWPIDTNLATWVSTLSIKALSHQPSALKPEQRMTLREWLLGQQHRVEHPYTHAAPGGWAWTDLPGGVPDADDSPGALLALLALGTVTSETEVAGRLGVQWLLDLQNRDGGMPTFCRGWGALPFDRSSQDLTAHALRAWSAWLSQLTGAQKRRTLLAIARALRYLRKMQRADGSWLPLWFGNEHANDDENPTYGTAQVVLALRELRQRGFSTAEDLERSGAAWLVRTQREDGAWGG
ncbi:MAG: prenyltransferase/squalene oxidase repeat-containing protein, partial [Chthoniobacteraceae bacterium]